MAHVVACDLLEVDGHIYRVRKSIGRSPIQHLEADEREVDWEEAEQDDHEEDSMDEALMTQEGDKYLTSIEVDPEVSASGAGCQGQLWWWFRSSTQQLRACGPEGKGCRRCVPT